MNWVNRFLLLKLSLFTLLDNLLFFIYERILVGITQTFPRITSANCNIFLSHQHFWSWNFESSPSDVQPPNEVTQFLCIFMLKKKEKKFIKDYILKNHDYEYTSLYIY